MRIVSRDQMPSRVLQPRLTLADNPGLLVVSGLHRRRKGQVRIRHRCVKRQVQRRCTAPVPVAVWHSSREDDQCSGPSLILLALDFDTHCASQDIENLIHLMSVQADRRATPSGRLDALDRTGLRPRGVIEQRLGETLVRTGSVNRCEINRTHVIHVILPTLWFYSVLYSTLSSLAKNNIGENKNGQKAAWNEYSFHLFLLSISYRAIRGNVI